MQTGDVRLKKASDYWRDKLLELMEKVEEQMKLDLPEPEDEYLNKED